MATGDKLVTLDGLKAVHDIVSGNISDLKSAFGKVEDCFDNPNVMDYTTLVSDNRMAQGTGNVKVASSNATSVIFSVEPETTYYLKITGGYNRRVVVGNNSATFVTNTTYTFISSTNDETTGIIFTTPANITYVFIYFYNGEYTFNKSNFTLYKGSTIPEKTGLTLKDDVLPDDVVKSEGAVISDINGDISAINGTITDILFNEHSLDIKGYYSSNKHLNIWAKLGKIMDDGILRVKALPSGIQFGVDGYSESNYTTVVTQTGWKKNVSLPFDITIDKDLYYLIKFAKNDFSAFSNLSDIDDADVQHVTNKKTSIDNSMPIVSQTVRTIAHRGDCLLAPDCTAPSYIIARKRGHTIAENDVWNSYDNEYVMWHDTTLGRCGDLVDINGYLMYTDGTDFYYVKNGTVYEWDDDNSEYVTSSASLESLTRCDGNDYSVTDINLATLKRIDVGVYAGSQFQGTQILTFKEWILLMKNLGMDAYIDRKIGMTTTIATELATIVKGCGMLDHVSWVGVPDASLIEAIRAVDPNARIGVLAHPSNENVVTYAPYNVGRGFFFNGNASDGLTNSAVQTGINAGFEVETYYVGWMSATRETIFNTIETALSYGVTGITLDHYRVDEAFRGMMDQYYIP